MCIRDRDGPWLQWEASNRDELLVFTDRQQCYKTRLSDFDDTKASVLGDYLPTKLGMDPEERLSLIHIFLTVFGVLMSFMHPEHRICLLYTSRCV